jgi:Rrf2 family protein
MRMSEGVEWAAHTCLVLDWLEAGEPVPTAHLAAAYDLPAPYLNKQLQALVRAGVLASTRGKGGGFALARPLERITLLDIVDAIEGREPAFRCREIRRCGMGAREPATAFRSPCSIAAAMVDAERGWRDALRSRTLAEIRDTTTAGKPGIGADVRHWYAARAG